MNNTNESGRSMVEMLGVLAIIGVLSIGGIAGYTQAMRRYRANEILNAISMLAVTAKTRTVSDAVNFIDAYPGATRLTGLADYVSTAPSSFRAETAVSTGVTTVYVEFDSDSDCKAVKSMVQGTSLMDWNSGECSSSALSATIIVS